MGRARVGRGAGRRQASAAEAPVGPLKRTPKVGPDGAPHGNDKGVAEHIGGTPAGPGADPEWSPQPRKGSIENRTCAASRLGKLLGAVACGSHHSQLPMECGVGQGIQAPVVTGNRGWQPPRRFPLAAGGGSC